MSSQPDKKSKLIIDEDYKSQVQAEKEALARQSAKGEQEGESTQATPGPMPPASLPMLISTLATQALIALGQIANPITQQAEVDMDQARHFIDTLDVLEKKTTGNLTPEESQMLEQVLHELRMVYVHVGQGRPAGDAAPPKE